MAQKSVDSKASGLESGQIGSPSDPKQLPTAAKKTPLQDLASENNVAMGKTETIKGSGIKRPSSDPQPNAPHHQSPGGNSVNGHLVYVRRKPETDAAKSTAVEATLNNGANGAQPQQVVAPIPATSSTSFSSLKLSVPHSVVKSDNKPVHLESRPQPVASVLPSSDQKRVKNQNWEERYVQLQMYLKKLDQSSQDEYLESKLNVYGHKSAGESSESSQYHEPGFSLAAQPPCLLGQGHELRALPVAELSKHAVELEKRSIQLSLEEGIELKRVRALDVLGKSKKAQSWPEGTSAG